MEQKHDALEASTETFTKANNLLDDLKSDTPETIALRGNLTDKKATAIKNIQNGIGSTESPLPTIPATNTDMSERLEALLDDEDIEIDEKIEKENLSFEGEEISEEYLEEWRTERPVLPAFPVFIFALTLVEDSLDFLDITIIGAIIAFVWSTLVGIIVFLWLFGKLKWWQRLAFRRFWTKFVLVRFLELIPFIGLIPLSSIYVVLAHYREKKAVKKLWEILSIFEGQLIKSGYYKE